MPPSNVNPDTNRLYSIRLHLKCTYKTHCKHKKYHEYNDYPFNGIVLYMFWPAFAITKIKQTHTLFIN